MLPLLLSKDVVAGLHKMRICENLQIQSAGLLQLCTYFSCMSLELGTVIWRERATDGFEGLLLQLHRQVQASKPVCGRLTLDSNLLWNHQTAIFLA